MDDRLSRMAAALERQLESCQSTLDTCLDARNAAEPIDSWPLARMLSLMKMSAQLATVIGKLDARLLSKNSGNRGSIPQ